MAKQPHQLIRCLFKFDVYAESLVLGKIILI